MNRVAARGDLMNFLHQYGGHVSAVRNALGGFEAEVRTFVDAGAVTAAEGHWRRLSERAAATDRKAARKSHRETLDRRVGGRRPPRPADRIEPTF